jgi:hypothetical protein
MPHMVILDRKTAERRAASEQKRRQALIITHKSVWMAFRAKLSLKQSPLQNLTSGRDSEKNPHFPISK